MLGLFTGPLALVLRYLLMILGSGLVTAGFMTSRIEGSYCFDASQVSELIALNIASMLGGGAAIAGSVGWRFWAKRRNGLT